MTAWPHAPKSRACDSTVIPLHKCARVRGRDGVRKLAERRLATTAKDDGEGGYIISGSKMWITNGAISDDEMGDVFLVYARTGEKRSELSLFLVEKGTPGFSVGQRIKDKCGACVCTIYHTI